MTDPAVVRQDGAATNCSEKSKPLLLVFYSPRSGPCRRAEGFLAQVLQRRHNHSTFRLHRIEAESHPDLVERFKISELPTLLVVDDRRVRARLTRPHGIAIVETTLGPWLH